MFSAFDYTAALQNADQEIAEIMRAPFLAALPQYIQNIEDASAQARYEDLHRHAHTLKGLAGNFAAEPVVQLSLQLELLARQQQTAAVTALISRLKEELSALSVALSALP